LGINQSTALLFTDELVVLGVDGEVAEADGCRAGDDVVREMRR